MTNIKNKNLSIKWVIALKSEANFIINYFKMKLLSKKKLFPIYSNSENTHSLVISGTGKVNSAAATMYLSESTLKENWTFWINIGIGGYKSNTYGKFYVIDKITEQTNGNTFYPGFQIKNNVNRASLLTLDQPETRKYKNQIYDMEGAGFFRVANKIVQKEFIILMKIISDTPSKNIKDLNNNTIERLFFVNKKNILNIIHQLEQISFEEMKKYESLRILDFIISKWNFSFSEKNQLEFFLRRLNASKKTYQLRDELKLFSNSGQILKYLKKELDTIEVDWEKID